MPVGIAIYAPSQVSDIGVERRGRRKEETLQRVAETYLLAGPPDDVVLPNYRQDRARDHVPVLAQLDRDDGLDVHQYLVAVFGSEASVVIEVERN